MLFIVAVCVYCVFKDPARPFQHFRSLVTARYISYLALSILGFSLALAFQAAFSDAKMSLSAGGFSFDKILADVDEWVHFGAAPHKLLIGLLGSSEHLPLVDWNYGFIWMIYTFGTLFLVMATSLGDGRRVGFVLCWVLCWTIVGNVLAGFFISAGPIFYGNVTGDYARFHALTDMMDAKSDVPGSLAWFRNYLWSRYTTQQVDVGIGISAFPSMHVSAATLAALFWSSVGGRWVKGLTWAYLVVILASSVYLGWHYAIDGYVSVIVTVAVYHAVRSGAAWLGSLNGATRREPGRVEVGRSHGEPAGSVAGK